MGKLDRIKTWVFKNKGKIIIGVLGFVTLGVVTALCSREKTVDSEPELLEIEEFDSGRDLSMEFRTEDGELLGKIGCTESYMDGFLLDEYGEDYRVNKDEA